MKHPSRRRHVCSARGPGFLPNRRRPLAPARSCQRRIISPRAMRNKDGALSLAEVQKADAKVTQSDFDKYDADHEQVAVEELSSRSGLKRKPPRRLRAPVSITHEGCGLDVRGAYRLRARFSPAPFVRSSGP